MQRLGLDTLIRPNADVFFPADGEATDVFFSADGEASGFGLDSSFSNSSTNTGSGFLFSAAKLKILLTFK